MMNPQSLHTFLSRWVIWLVAFAAVFTSLIGSAFNIWYNLIHVEPLLTDAQHDLFQLGILINNAIVYPVTTVVIFRILRSVAIPYYHLLAGKALEELDPQLIERARRRTVNLPILILLIGTLAWLSVIPGLTLAVYMGDEAVNPWFVIHLSISVIISAMIAMTHGLFATELIAQKFLYPVMFAGCSASDIARTIPMTLRRRGIMWAISAGVCPILTLLLLDTVSRTPDEQMLYFKWAVGVLGIGFGIGSALLLSQLVVRPVRRLEDASRSVAGGELDVEIEERRSDEFGALIDSFNTMVEEMRAKRSLQQTFGLYVGEQAAEAILSEGGLGGRVKTITVMFCDIRSFTPRCRTTSAEEIVTLLNLFLTRMVDVVEAEHHGLVNQFLGDGFMAIFGITNESDQPELDAVLAGVEMLNTLGSVNEKIIARGAEPFQIGVGIHTGPAVVGSIGSDRRREYTAIGDTVNLASRLEGLSKVAGARLVMSEATMKAVEGQVECRSLGDFDVKGVEGGMTVYGVKAE